MSSTARTTDTLRNLILDQYEITLCCKACTNRVKADLAALARRYGLDWEWFGQRWPYHCTRCGSTEVGMTLLPDVRPNTSPDRQADLAAAKALVAQLEGEERRR